MARLDNANARIGARRARLLGAAGLRAMLAAEGLEARLAPLRARPLGAALPGRPGEALAEVEAALRAGWRREAEALLRTVEGERAHRLLVAALALEDAEAVKALLRAVAAGRGADALAAGLPPAAGVSVSEGALRAAAAAGGLDGALAALAAGGWPPAGAARAALPAPAEARTVAVELAIDRAAFDAALRACRGGGEDGAVLRSHLRDRIDARNAATLLALAGTPPAVDAFLPGGARLGPAAFEALAGAPPAAVRAGLSRRLGCPPAALERPWSADRALEAAVLRPLRREARGRTLSLAVPLAYLAERRAEVRRVALLLRGVALGLPGDEILDLVEA